MSAPTAPRRFQWLRSHAELGVAVLLFGFGVVVLADAASMPADFTQRGPIGPTAVPYGVGALLLTVAVLLAVDVLRGGRGAAESGEDVDLSAPTDWRTVLLLAGSFLVNAALIDVAGWPVSGALLFWGSAYALGSRHWIRDPVIAVVLSVSSYLVFAHLLGVPLPAGWLDGVI